MASCEGFRGHEDGYRAVEGHAPAVWRFDLAEPDDRGRASRLSCAVCEPRVAAALRSLRIGHSRVWMGAGRAPSAAPVPRDLSRPGGLAGGAS